MSLMKGHGLAMKSYTIDKDQNKALSSSNIDMSLKNNEITFTIAWPIDAEIRLLLAFACTPEDDCRLKSLIANNHPHDVVTRDLNSQYRATIIDEKCKFVLCPAYFVDKHTVAVCQPFETDWICKKSEVTARVKYTPLMLSKFQKASIFISPTDVNLDAISYTITEPGRISQAYPLDTTIASQGGHMYILKSQSVRFHVNEAFEDTVELV